MKDDKKIEETVQVPVSVLQQLQTRLAALEHAEAVRREEHENPRAKIIDPTFEQWKERYSRPPQVLTQERADKEYTGPKRFKVWLDSSSEDGKPGPKIGEHPTIEISAHSPEEAEGRYLKLCGIKKHNYRLRAEPVAA